ncbi:MAG: Hsp70 family protein [Hymenobacter sp.]
MATVAINLATGSLQQEEIIVGIDLGTTNSLVAYVHPENRQPVAINDQGRGSIVPSMVHFPADGAEPVGRHRSAANSCSPTRSAPSTR